MVHKYEKCINMYSILNLIIELSNIHVLDSEDTMLDIYFKERPPLDPGKIRYASANGCRGQNKRKHFVYVN